MADKIYGIDLEATIHCFLIPLPPHDQCDATMKKEHERRALIVSQSGQMVYYLREIIQAILAHHATFGCKPSVDTILTPSSATPRKRKVTLSMDRIFAWLRLALIVIDGAMDAGEPEWVYQGIVVENDVVVPFEMFPPPPVTATPIQTTDTHHSTTTTTLLEPDIPAELMERNARYTVKKGAPGVPPTVLLVCGDDGAPSPRGFTLNSAAENRVLMLTTYRNLYRQRFEEAESALPVVLLDTTRTPLASIITWSRTDFDAIKCLCDSMSSDIRTFNDFLNIPLYLKIVAFTLDKMEMVNMIAYHRRYVTASPPVVVVEEEEIVEPDFETHDPLAIETMHEVFATSPSAVFSLARELIAYFLAEQRLHRPAYDVHKGFHAVVYRTMAIMVRKLEPINRAYQDCIQIGVTPTVSLWQK